MGKHQQECDYLAMIASQAEEIAAFKSENIALRKVWGERCEELDVLKRQRSVGIFRRKQCTGYGDFSDIDWLDGEYPIKDLQLYVRPVPAIPAIPEGYVLVPIEPTNEMIESVFDNGVNSPIYYNGYELARMVYKAIISAAQEKSR